MSTNVSRTAALLFLISIFVGIIATDQCGTHEEYTCGSLCVETCDYTPEICTFDCAFGCYCKKGFVRYSNAIGSPCILKRDCENKLQRPKCPRHEKHLKCGSACPLTCAHFRYPISTEPDVCIAVCVQGCFCKDGYYRADNGKCVRAEKCCSDDRNEKYTTCGSACVATCDYTPTECTEQCVFGCFCRSARFVRRDNSTNSRCIRRSKCPK